MAKKRRFRKPMSASARYQASQRQHVRLSLASKDPVKRIYHRDIRELQEMENRVYTKQERKRIWNMRVQQQKKWVPPTVTYAPGFGDVFVGGSDNW